MRRRVELVWTVRQLMADRGMFTTTDLLPLLADRDVHLTRQAVHRLVTSTPQRINLEVLAALCDIFDCAPSDLLVPHVPQTAAPRRQRTAAAAGPVIGELRPARTQVRRPDGA